MQDNNLFNSCHVYVSYYRCVSYLIWICTWILICLVYSIYECDPTCMLRYRDTDMHNTANIPIYLESWIYICIITKSGFLFLPRRGCYYYQGKGVLVLSSVSWVKNDQHYGHDLKNAQNKTYTLQPNWFKGYKQYGHDLDIGT